MDPDATDHDDTTLERLLEAWQRLVWRHALVVLVVTGVLLVGAVRLIAGGLGINTDTSDMLSDKLPWRAAYLQYTEAFPQNSDSLTIVVDADTPDEASDAAIRLASRLAEEEALFEWVYLPRLSDFFRRNGLLFVSVEELEALADRLAEVQPFLARLGGDASLRTLFELLGEAAEARAGDDAPPMAETLAALEQTLAGTLATPGARPQRLSWQRLMGADSEDDGGRAIVQVKPRLDFSRLLPGEAAVLHIRDIVRELGLTPDKGFSVRQTGSAALGYEELQSVSVGARKAGLLALVMVTAVLVIGLRSPLLVLATLVSLLTGLVFTAAFATFAIGELNMISVAFAVLYIGLGVDFAIHYCLRYRELSREHDRPAALIGTSRHIGASLVLCAITTALGFYAFIPTAYSGVAELGLISGTGMFISLTVSLTVLPAILRFLPRPRAARQWLGRGPQEWHAFPVQHRHGVLLTGALLVVLAGAALPRADFDHNPIHLQDPTTESVKTFRDLLKNSRLSPLSISVLAPDQETAVDWKRDLGALPSVHAVGYIDDLVPTGQEDKLLIVEDLALILGALDDGRPGTAPDVDATLSALDHLIAKLSPVVAETGDPQFRALAATLRDLRAAADEASAQARRELLERVRIALLGNLPGRLDALRESLRAEVIRTDSLPADLRARWQSGRALRLEVWPEQDLDDNEYLETFVAEVRSVVGDAATGAPVINVGASAAVTEAFQQAFAYALLANTVVIWLLLRRGRDVLLVLCPLLVAGAITGAITVAMGTPFNFANIIALPLLLGMGVDSAVHMLHRQRTRPAPQGRVLGTSTARGVVFSALTTACSFGNLALSPHAGTASMGLLLSIGVLFTLLSTLLLLPAMMALPAFANRSTR